MVPQDDRLISDAFEMGESVDLAIHDLLCLPLAKSMTASLNSKDEAQTKAARRLGIAVVDVRDRLMR